MPTPTTLHNSSSNSTSRVVYETPSFPMDNQRQRKIGESTLSFLMILASLLVSFSKLSWSFTPVMLGIRTPVSGSLNSMYHDPNWKRKLVRLQIKVDPYRDANNVRPSLHPITINILSQALKLRSSAFSDPNSSANSTSKQWSLDDPLEIFMTVSSLAAKAMAQRQSTSVADHMTLTVEEQQTVAGRVVGVMVRIADLQQLLYRICQDATWIAKYNEWHSFGLVPPKALSGSRQDYNDYDNLLQDPLLLLNRAECLLALFIHTVEVPELLRKNCTVPDQSIIDFLDEDRRQVLLVTIP